MAIFYLNDIDHYIKEILKCKYYIRYMDDMYILSDNKDYLKYCFESISNELSKIKLCINKKSGIYRLKEGISFLGYTYVCKNNKLFIRYDSETIRKINRKIKYLYENNFELYFRSISSYKGYFIRCNTSLFFYRYNDICTYNRYDKYLIIKKKYSNYMVFIKYKNRYYTYNDDLIYINNYFDKKYEWLSKKNLCLINCNYVILDGNEIILK